MNTEMIFELFLLHFHQTPQDIQRCTVGIGNYVYIVKCENKKYILRCSKDEDAYKETNYWLEKLSGLDVPASKVLHYGKQGEVNYLILNYIEGKDIGLVYRDLTGPEKRAIAKEVIKIQRVVSQLQLENIDNTWCWVREVDELLERSYQRIEKNGYFDLDKVRQVRSQKNYLDEYFGQIRPVAYLDDISTKNLLIQDGKLSGIIDVDWMGIGDDLTFIALTYVALLNMDCETDYIEYLLEERGCSEIERKAFLFYSLLFCVDFMGERGTSFGDKKIEVNEEIINRLNQIYDMLWKKWCEIREG